MEIDTQKIIVVLGYIVALLSPLLGLIYGAILFFYKKDVPEYRKHGRYIIYLAIVVFVVSLAISLAMGWV